MAKTDMESILTSVKKACNVSEEYDVFDDDIIMHINSVFMILNQLGVGPKAGFRIEDKSNEWSEFIPEDDLRFEAVKTYVCSKVRLIFDTPSNSIITECLKQIIAECEWRLNLAAES